MDQEIKELPTNPKDFGPNYKRVTEFWNALPKEDQKKEYGAWLTAKQKAYAKDLALLDKTKRKKPLPEVSMI